MASHARKVTRLISENFCPYSVSFRRQSTLPMFVGQRIDHFGQHRTSKVACSKAVAVLRVTVSRWLPPISFSSSHRSVWLAWFVLRRKEETPFARASLRNHT